ncbi:hypothetical protein TA3x_001978 [Tundrisphaera sp. TA3]|uniref:hypothetical protein n=1 Tax=Tundrisphaera sp. TA3 TaxID=3435775 RepID=UPI003EB94605
MNQAIVNTAALATESATNRNWDETRTYCEKAIDIAGENRLDASAANALEVVHRLLEQANEVRAKQFAEKQFDMAIEATRSGNFAVSQRLLESYVSSKFASRLSAAKPMLEYVQVAMSNEKALKYLRIIVFDEFKLLLEGGVPPRLKALKIQPLTEAALDSLRRNLGDAIAGREELTKKDEESVRLANSLRHGSRAFEEWIEYRLHRDPSTRQEFARNFSASRLMNTLDELSETESQRQEFRHVQQIMDTNGFSAFLVHFEEILRNVYNDDSFILGNHESDVRRELEVKKNDIYKSFIEAVAKNIPKR